MEVPVVVRHAWKLEVFGGNGSATRLERRDWTDVRFWLLADLLPGRDLRPFYPRKRTFDG